MKILHIIETLGAGGAERQLLTQLPEIQRMGHEVVVAYFREPSTLAPDLERAGVRTLKFTPRHRWALLGYAKEIADLVGREQFDIVHSHLYFPTIALALSRYRKLHNAHTCVTFHNLAYAGANRKNLQLALRKALAQFIYPKGIDAFFGVSQAVADHYSTELRLAKVGLAINPVDLDAVKQIQRTPNNNGAFKLVVPGRLVREKGHEDLLNALSLIATSAAPFICHIVGDGPLKQKIYDQAQALGLTPNIVFHGQLPHNELLTVVASADLALVPSIYEGFGLTALEAMAAGTPVIATTAGGLPEVVGDAGILVNPANPKELASAIIALIRDGNRLNRMASAGKLRAEKFSTTAVCANLLSSYIALMDKPRPKAK